MALPSVFSRSAVIFGLAGLCLCFALPAAAAITPEQRKEAAAIRAEVDKAGKLYLDQKFEEAGDVIRTVQERVDKFAATADAQAIQLLDPVMTRLTRAHALLELEGVELLPLKKPEPMGEKPMDKPAPAAGEGTSFAKEIAPLLVAKCGNCHVRQARGEVSMANYAALMKGPPEGVIIFPGKADGSRILEVIESGDMPRGGGKIAEAEYELLKKWINEGAKFDGPDPATALGMLTDAKADAPAMVKVEMATGKETISFARDVAPVLAGTCFNCHGGGQQTRADFNLTTFTGLLKGGDSGPVVTPGKGADSLLIKKLKGTAEGNRMPQNLPPLADSIIAKIETWIDEGAKYDGGDANLDLKQVADLARAQAATHEELMEERKKLAAERWRLGLPGIQAATVETDNFLVVGNLGENSLREIGQQAEAIAPKVGELLNAPADKPLIKGRMTLFVFSQRYDYAEFGNMVERRELPKALKGHFVANPIEVYGAFISSRSEEYSTEVMIAQQLAGGYINTLGKGAPRWFSEGVARATAAKLNNDDPRVIEWDVELPRVLGTMAAPDDFLTGKLSPEDSDICNYSFARFLMKDSRKFDQLLSGLAKGQEFTQTFSTVYRGSPSQLTYAWVKSGPVVKRKR